MHDLTVSEPAPVGADLPRVVNWFFRRWKAYAEGIDPRDLAQTIWVAVLEANAKFDPARAQNILALARPIVRGRVIDFVRLERSRGIRTTEPVSFSGLYPSHPQPPPKVVADGAGAGEWEAAAAVLSDRERAVLRLRFADDLTQHEVAARLGVTQGRVWKLESRARRKLVHTRE